MTTRMVVIALLLGLGQQPAGLGRAQPAVESVAASINGRVGVAAMGVETGDLMLVHGDERFPMQSVYKVPIAMAVLQRVDAGEIKLSQLIHVRRSDLVPAVHSPIRDMNPNGTSLTVRELLRAAIVESDGTASDVLLILAPLARVTTMVRGLGIKDMMFATTERTMAADVQAQYRNWSTPRAMAQLLRALVQGRVLAAPSRVLLIAWLTETTIGENRIKGLLPAGTAVAHKTGTDNTRNGMTRATNDAGIVTLPGGRHLAVAVFIRDSKATEAQRESAIAKIARAIWSAARQGQGQSSGR